MDPLRLAAARPLARLDSRARTSSGSRVRGAPAGVANDSSGSSASDAPAPRFDRTPGAIARPPCYAGQHTDENLTELGLDPKPLRETGAVA